MVREHTLYDLILLTLFYGLTYGLYWFVENILHVLEKNVYSIVGWSVLSMSVGSGWFIVLFESSISLLIFYLVVATSSHLFKHTFTNNYNYSIYYFCILFFVLLIYYISHIMSDSIYT